MHACMDHMHAVPARGRLLVDAGCAEAVRAKKNIYGAGIVGVEGTFGAMDAVHIDCAGVPVARGLVNYSSEVWPPPPPSPLCARRRSMYGAPRQRWFLGILGCLGLRLATPTHPLCVWGDTGSMFVGGVVAVKGRM